MTGAYSLGLETFELAYQGLFQHWNPKLLSSLEASISGLEQARFYGFGNETSDDDRGNADFFKTDQLQYNVLPSLRYALSPQLDVVAGPHVTYSSTDDDDTLLNRLQPYGEGGFGLIALQGGFDFDSRDGTKPMDRVFACECRAACFRKSRTLMRRSASSKEMWRFSSTPISVSKGLVGKSGRSGKATARLQYALVEGLSCGSSQGT